MTDRSFFESEAILDVFAHAISTIGFHGANYAASDIAESIPRAVADKLNDEVISLLADPALNHLVNAISQQSLPTVSAGYGWRIRNISKGGHPISMTFYRVSQSWASTALSLAGLSIGIYMMSPGALLSVVALVRNTWQNLLTLSRPEDDLAIDAYQALLKAELDIATNCPGVSEELRFPTLDHIHRSVKQQELVLTVSGLTVLAEKGLVAVCHWDGTHGDHSNLKNRWKQVF